LLWHDRSFGPERFWGEFYVRFLQKIKTEKVWFASAGQAVDWFRKRRAVVFSRDDSPSATTRAQLCAGMSTDLPPLTIRVHAPECTAAEDHTWTGNAELDLDTLPGSSNRVRQRVAVETV
jgi:hypothetical protein